MSIIDTIYQLVTRFRQVILYGIIGVSALFLELLSFFALNRYAHTGIAAANGIAMSLGLVVSFSLNATVNFKVGDQLLSRFFRFAVITTLGYFLSTAIITGLVQYAHIAAFAAKLASLPAFFLFQYTANKRFTFQRPRVIVPGIPTVPDSATPDAV